MTVAIEAPDERLPAPVEATAYYIVSEALTNVVKHSGAAGARVTVVREGDVLRCAVSDDGRGGAAAVGRRRAGRAARSRRGGRRDAVAWSARRAAARS